MHMLRNLGVYNPHTMYHKINLNSENLLRVLSHMDTTAKKLIVGLTILFNIIILLHHSSAVWY